MVVLSESIPNATSRAECTNDHKGRQMRPQNEDAAEAAEYRQPDSSLGSRAGVRCTTEAWSMKGLRHAFDLLTYNRNTKSRRRIGTAAVARPGFPSFARCT